MTVLTETKIHHGFRRCAVLMVLITVIGCSRSGPPVQSLRFGSRLDVSGKISDRGLVYRFPRHPRQGTVKNLFNHIYFEGDTVCFSMVLDNSVDLSTVRVDFVDPSSGKTLRAERLELEGHRVFGFSLVGSILENFYNTQLARKALMSNWDGRSITFRLRVLLMIGGKTVKEEYPGSFRIEL